MTNANQTIPFSSRYLALRDTALAAKSRASLVSALVLQGKATQADQDAARATFQEAVAKENQQFKMEARATARQVAQWF